MSDYQELVDLCSEFRKYAEPEFVNGVPDYTDDAMVTQIAGLPDYRRRLAAIDTTGWPVTHLVDYEIVRGEMNGMEFDHRVLRPWKRNPSFYALLKMEPSDVPEDEINHVNDVLRHYEYEFPLHETAKREYRVRLERIPGLMDQARGNLTDNAKTLFFYGIREMRGEAASFDRIIRVLAEYHPDVVPIAERAKAAVETFTEWLQKKHEEMTDSHDGIGVEEFNWCMRNVHFVPFSWHEQRNLIQRELERGWSSLALEEKRNSHLPPLSVAESQEELQRRSTEDRRAFFDFIRKSVFTVKDYMNLGDTVGEIAEADNRDFFVQCLYRDFLALRCHDIHWIELQREERNTHPIRHRPPLYNLWAFRSEGFATAFEEMMLQAGFLDVRPRAREITYLLIAFRAARAMGGLMMQANEWTLQEAIDFAAAKTPRGWLKPDGEVIKFDLGLYLQQPEYGTSYLVGKTQFDRLLAECAYLRGDSFDLIQFMDEYFSLGTIPASLVRWEMTGKRDPIMDPESYKQ